MPVDVKLGSQFPVQTIEAEHFHFGRQVHQTDATESFDIEHAVM